MHGNLNYDNLGHLGIRTFGKKLVEFCEMQTLTISYVIINPQKNENSSKTSQLFQVYILH